MRRAALIALAVVFAPEARAATCDFVDVGIPPIRFQDRLVVYQRRLMCPGAAKGEIRVTLETRLGDKTHRVSTERRRVRGNGRWPNEVDLVEKGFPNGYCRLADRARKDGELPRRLRKKARLGRFGGREAVVVPVPVEATLRGTGDFSELYEVVKTRAFCRACPRPKGRLGLYDGRSLARVVRRGSRLKAKVDGDFFRCAAPHAKLEVRIFAAPDEIALERSFRPVLVIENLKKRFRRGRGGDFVLDLPAPARALCRKVKTPEAQLFAIETAGEGTLKKITGGGRARFRLGCR